MTPGRNRLDQIDPDKFVDAVFKALGEADYKLARWSQKSEPWHYWCRETIDTAIRDALTVISEESVDD